MKVLVQRVTSANVKVNNKVVGEINRGILLFVGFTQRYHKRNRLHGR